MRLSRLIVGTALAVAALVLPQAVVPASAAVTDLACNFDRITFNACLNFTEPTLNVLDAHVGLDAKMPQRYAQEIVDIGGLNTQAQLFATPGRFIADMAVVSGSPSAGPTGLSVRLITTGLSRGDLNINTGAGAQESFFVEVSYFDPHGQGAWKTFRTGTVTGDFAPR
ncbi:hypothetical protein [Actinophytocola sp.]|uniref:hypothetical protein n=1 Tax=Actinophytocola sp. TaxID=1872138 RepID=UPI00389A478E